jgi:pullulanase
MTAFPAPHSPRQAAIARLATFALLGASSLPQEALAAQSALLAQERPAMAVACTDTAAATLLQAAREGAPLHARAIWLDARTLRWPGRDTVTAPATAGRYVLYASDSATLRAVPGDVVRGANDTLRVPVSRAELPVAVAARVRHVGAGVTLRLPAGIARTRLERLHTRQLLLVHENDGGRVIDATGTQSALALDALYAGAADALTFGAVTTASHTDFRLWAPTAQAVALCRYDTEGDGARVVPLQRHARSGTWHVRLPDAPHGTRYRYLVDVEVPGVGVVRNRVTDPWSLALTANSTHSVVADLSHPSLTPVKWRARRAPRLAHPTDQVIYELHVRDFSVGDTTVPPPHRGGYLAFTDSASHGMRHLRALAHAGLTDVHLLPVFDIATIPEVGCRTPVVPRGAPNGEEQQAAVSAAAADDCFNWGYDPLHYTVPEGSYATDVTDFGARIREFRRMVLALNAAGLRVGMDVVYNHTSASGQAAHSVLDRIVPGYYHRLDASGRVETSTCCANTATEHRIMAKLMIESALTWVRHYGISSFRFDLMGHQPRAAMERLQRAVDIAAGAPVPLIGEGWNFGEVADGRRFVQASQLALPGTGIATFSDRARDAIRGGSALDEGISQVRNQGWVNGLAYAPNDERQRSGTATEDRAALMLAADMVRMGLAGSLRAYRLVTADGSVTRLADLSYGGQPAGYVQAPHEVVNYVENHDNPTLFDANVLKLPAGTSREDRARVQLLGSSLVLFSQGIAYVHAGQELLRSKSLDRNSFDSGDWFNSYDPTGAQHGFARGLPPRKDNEASWPFMRERLADTTIVPSPALVRFTRDAFLDLLRIRASSTLFRLRSTSDVQQRLRFANVGPAQEPTVIAAHLDGRGYTDAAFADVLYAVNADTVAHAITVPWLSGRPLRLHPVHRSRDAADQRPSESLWDSARGVLTVPPRTAVVWVRE